MNDTLAATVTGSATGGAPIVAAVWSGCCAVLQSAPDKWHDARDVANRAADLVDARPSLGDELLHAAVSTGLLDTRTHRGRQQVRLTTQQEDTA